jgi:phage shock protein C
MTEDHNLTTEQHHPKSRRLYRSRTDRMIGGVAGGLGEYFHLDPTLMRLIIVAFMFLGGSGLLAYFIAWIIVPLEPEPASQGS